MIARAMLVLLAVLNLGVAAWWLARDVPAQVPPVDLPADVARLELLGETDTGNAPAPVVAARRCVQFGPWHDPAQLQRAREVLAGLARGARLQVVRRQAPAAQGWRVVMPPLADAAQAQATARRIDAAGFDDYLVIGDGAEANSIALGRFSDEAGARSRQEALHEAGFDAQAHPLGGEAGFIAIALAERADVAALGREIGALQTMPIDCARLD